jgi:hypothetical protein
MRHCQTAEGVASVQCSLAMLAQADAALGCSWQYMQLLHSTYFMAIAQSTLWQHMRAGYYPYCSAPDTSARPSACLW